MRRCESASVDHGPLEIRSRDSDPMSVAAGRGLIIVAEVATTWGIEFCQEAKCVGSS